MNEDQRSSARGRGESGVNNSVQPKTLEEVVSGMGFDEARTASILVKFLSELARLTGENNTVGEVITEQQARTILLDAVEEALSTASEQELAEIDRRILQH